MMGRGPQPPRAGARRGAASRSSRATVVRAQRPTSAEAGDTALVLADGTIEGFVGGDCAEHSVRAYALKAIESGEPILLRILPFGDGTQRGGAARGGAVTVQNPCLSGGAIEVFLEPVLRAPRVLVEGDTPIARGAAAASARSWASSVAGVAGEDFEPRAGDLALVVAGHGRDELAALRRGLEAGVPYVGLVASRRRGAGRDRRAARRRRRRRAARAHRHARRAGHRRAHAGRDRASRSSPGSSRCAGASARARRRRDRVDPICGMTVDGRPRHALARARRRDGPLLLRGLPATPSRASMPLTDPFVCGLVLGAGGSKRLGRPKQLLPYGDGTLLGHVVGTARACRFDQTIVAIGGAADDVRAGVDLAAPRSSSTTPTARAARPRSPRRSASSTSAATCSC